MKAVTDWLKVPVLPMGAPRMTQRDKWAKRDVVVRYHKRCDALRLFLRRYHGINYDGVELRAYFPVPVSHSKKKRNELLSRAWHQQKPDGDNILKFVCDALFKEDKILAHKSVDKFWTKHDEGYMTVRFFRIDL